MEWGLQKTKKILKSVRRSIAPQGPGTIPLFRIKEKSSEASTIT